MNKLKFNDVMKLYLVSQMFNDESDNSSHTLAPLSADDKPEVDTKEVKDQLGKWIDQKIENRVGRLDIPKAIDVDRLQNDLASTLNRKLETVKKQLMSTLDQKLTQHDQDIEKALNDKLDATMNDKLKAIKEDLEKTIDDSMKASSSVINIEDDPEMQAAVGNTDQGKSIVDPQEYNVRDANEDMSTSLQADKELAEKKKKAELAEKEAHQDDLTAKANNDITKVAAEAESASAIKDVDDDADKILNEKSTVVEPTTVEKETDEKPADEKPVDEKSAEKDDLPYNNDDSSVEEDEEEEIPEDEVEPEDKSDDEVFGF